MRAPRIHYAMAGLVVSAALVFLAACEPASSKSSRGFRLPEGDAEAGRVAFGALGCASCHRVEGVDSLPRPDAEPALQMPLGGEVAHVKTYGMLVTAIVYPQHGIARDGRPDYVGDGGVSLMPDMTGRMTVRQLIDIVAFLQENYRVKTPAYTRYQTYPTFP